MPIPHLSHKIHSPNNWKGKKSKERKSSDDIQAPGKKKSLKFKAIFKKSLPYLMGLILLFIISGIALAAWISKDLPDPNKLSEREVAQSTKIYDRTGEHLLYEIHGDQKRTIIPLADIPNHAIQATLALEDQKFFEHQGFNLWGMFRGVVLRSLEGKSPQGGSTLTQQLIKNAILGDERTVTRKLKELILAYELERKYSKEEILQMYFNEIPYGSTAYGIEAAAQTYFNKSARDLNLAESAVIASLPQAPSYLWNHKDDLYARQHYALDQMAKLNYISVEEAETAKQIELTFSEFTQGIEAPHFVFYVKEVLSEKYGEKAIEQGGYKIISTLDFDLQKKAEEILREQAEKNLANYNANNAALVAIDPKTGQILAMVGSKDYFDEAIDGQVNVTLSKRQPGSSFKPMVYTAGFMQGYVPETTLYDLVTDFPTYNGSYTPHNYDLQQRGPVTIRKALAGSLNIPAVKMIYLVGIDKVLDLADNLGYTTFGDRSRFGLSLVLGGGEVTLLEHTNAFATLARDGKNILTTPVLKLEDSQGKTMEEYTQQRGQKVIDEKYVRMTTDILSDNNSRAYIFGSNNYLTLSDRPVAAKTGTTNNYHDAWTLGYTPQLAVGVWVGNNDNSEMKRGSDGSVVAAPIWQKFMTAAHTDKPVENFIKPSYEIPNKPMVGGYTAKVTATIDKLSGLLATEYTPEHLREEKVYQQAHSILYYVNKEDPLGDRPANPNDDEHFQAWERPVLAWAAANGIANEAPPTEKDNLHRPEDQPAINWTSPQNDQVINDQLIQMSVQASAPQGVTKVQFFLDNQLIGTSQNYPYEFTYAIPPNILNGQKTLTAKVFDQVENTAQSSINITIQRESDINITWLNPVQGTTLTTNNFPYQLSINVESSRPIKKVDFYYQLIGSGDSGWINYIDRPSAGNIQVIWASSPAVGTYKVYPVLTVGSDYLRGPEITVSVE